MYFFKKDYLYVCDCEFDNDIINIHSFGDINRRMQLNSVIFTIYRINLNTNF